MGKKVKGERTEVHSLEWRLLDASKSQGSGESSCSVRGQGEDIKNIAALHQ